MNGYEDNNQYAGRGIWIREYEEVQQEEEVEPEPEAEVGPEPEDNTEQEEEVPEAPDPSEIIHLWRKVLRND